MKFTVAIVIVTLSAVVIGIFNRRWAIACAFFVLHIAIGSFIIGCMSHWAAEHQQVAVSIRVTCIRHWQGNTRFRDDGAKRNPRLTVASVTVEARLERNKHLPQSHSDTEINT